MEHGLRPRQRQRVLDRGGVAAVAQHAAQQQIGEFRTQLLLDAVEVVLRDLHQRQRLHAQARDLPAQLGTDRPAAPAHQHALAGKPGADRGPVERDRIAPEQILDRDFLELVEAAAALDHVLQARHGAERQAGALAALHHALHLLIAGAGHGDQQHLRGHLARQLVQAREVAQHRDAVHFRAAQRAVVVEEADRRVTVLAPQLARQRLAGAAGAQDQHAARRLAMAGVVAAVLPEAVKHARAAEKQQQRQRIHQQHRARHAVEAAHREKRQRDGERAEGAGTRDVPQVRQAGEAPQTAIQAGPVQHHPLRDQHDRQLRLEQGDRVRFVAHREAHQIGDVPGQPHHDEVVHHHSQARVDGSHEAVGAHQAGLRASTRLPANHTSVPAASAATPSAADHAGERRIRTSTGRTTTTFQSR